MSGNPPPRWVMPPGGNGVRLEVLLTTRSSLRPRRNGAACNITEGLSSRIAILRKEQNSFRRLVGTSTLGFFAEVHIRCAAAGTSPKSSSGFSKTSRCKSRKNALQAAIWKGKSPFGAAPWAGNFRLLVPGRLLFRPLQPNPQHLEQ